jgi:protein disulfide-isomerase
MKVSVCAVLVGATILTAQAQSWMKKEAAPEKSKGFIENFDEAKKEAAAFKQPIFAFFTGSDWCGWCMKLRSEALDTKEFEKFAADNLILFEADFPRGKKQSSSVKKQNEALAAKYGVKGYPSVFLLDADGKELGQTGYQKGGAEAYVKHVKQLLEKAGITTVDKAAAGKSLSAYERMKVGKEAKVAGGEEKKD